MGPDDKSPRESGDLNRVMCDYRTDINAIAFRYSNGVAAQVSEPR